MVFEKYPVNFSVTNCLSEYQQLLTPYAYSFVVKQFELSHKVKVTGSLSGNNHSCTIFSNGKKTQTSDSDCDCGFYSAMKLPCRHIFALRRHALLDTYEEGLCALRWSRQYYRSNHRLFCTIQSITLLM